jgi:hypothetical protein
MLTRYAGLSTLLISVPLLSVALLSVMGCGDDEGDSPGTGAAGNSGGASTGGAAPGGAGSGGDGGASSGGAASGGAANGGAGGESACYDPGPLEFGPGPNGEPSCLTFAGASDVCGFESDGSICTFSVGCGASTDMGQCQINCEMGTTVNCYAQSDVDCIIAAMCADDCTALTACGFIL